jgi:hypothetical protein
MTRPVVSSCLLLLMCLAAMPAHANSIEHLYFDSLQDLQPVANRYMGVGISFSSNALALTSSLVGGLGSFTNNPSGNNILAFQTGNGVTMNVAQGFSNGVAFYYSAVTTPGTVSVWSGTNGTGSLLATINLGTNGNSGCQAGTTFCVWTPVGLTFSGTAMSVTFNGKAGQIGFDSVTVGKAVPAPVPEPASIFLLGTGMVGVSIAGRLKKFFGSRG